MHEGKEFQSTGAAEENDRSLNVTKVFTEGGSKRSFVFNLILYLDGDLRVISSV